MASAKEENNTRVLIVEDEPTLRDIYVIKLEAEGFSVHTGNDGADGLNKAIQITPDIILLDIILPIKDGFQVLQDLKMNPKTKNIPVIILSNLGQSYEVKRGLSLGAEAFLTKANLVPSRVVEEINRVLNRK